MFTSLVLLTSFFVPGPEPAKVNAGELKRLQGTWDIVTFEKTTGKVPADQVQVLSVTIKDDRWIIKVRDGKEHVARVVILDPKAKPGRLSLEIGGQTYHSVYRFDKDLLIANVGDAGNPAPMDFRPTKSDTGGVLTYRRKAMKD